MDERKPAPPGEAAENTPTPAAGPEGDFELARPTAGADAGNVAIESTGAARGDAEPEGAAEAGARPERDDGRVQEPAGRDKPLHDPDPYSTPPYGEPGPWAPAPPVRHPATTPVHGTAVADAGPGHGAAGLDAVPVPVTASGSGAVVAAPAPVVAPAAAEGPGAAASAPAATPPSAEAAPAPAPPPAEVSAPGSAVPAQIPAPTSEATGFAGRPADPVPPADPHLLPDPDPHSGQDQDSYPYLNEGQDPYPSQDANPQPYPDQDPQPGPWHRYDPWAAPAPAPVLALAPFQQSGAVVLTEGQRRRRVRRALVGGALALALVCGGAGGLVGAYLERNGGISEVHLPQAGREPADRPAGSVAGIAARALPSVVTLHVAGRGEQGTGTGFVLDTNGHILTNNHVVEPAGPGGDITVAFSGGESAKARVVGRDSGYDLAVVQVKGVQGLKPLPLGNSDNVQVGDPVVAIGAPFDLANTVTSGIISAKGRPITAGGESGEGGKVSYVDALQTDAPINPGNSGGPLLDTQARVIGINSAIRSADDGSDTLDGQAGSIGLGFAIPVNQAKRVAEELINDGRATHPVIGVALDMAYTGDGARISTEGSDGPAVTTGGPGDLAGLRAGDVITEVDRQRVHSGDELIVRIRAHRPGDRLVLTVQRGGEEKRMSLVLGSSEQN
ncbi:trypsin-like peptidase domain-containing protein [Streptomyces sp. NPDC006012]|uniref:trypsin-like peptidase domain-containing protein n=1 Tax=Streptomyces sp. NPDC006012 TaxID=3364739 RepID=UPI00369DB777